MFSGVLMGFEVILIFNSKKGGGSKIFGQVAKGKAKNVGLSIFSESLGTPKNYFPQIR